MGGGYSCDSLGVIMFALIDCNNFYASCERLFRPDLRNKPIIVLSNNDGCIIARSNEAKALGIAMGAPYFKIRAFCKQHQVHVFSSNYTFYGDMSYRVMRTIEDAWSAVEMYSIDEAFLDLSKMPLSMHYHFCSALQQLVLKSTGIPTSIGIGPTKTLAKIANHMAKKLFSIPVVDFKDHQESLHQVMVGDVWGVGRQWQKKLMQHGICTAADLANSDHQFIRNTFNVVLLRTAMELGGTPCGGLAPTEKKQSILSSRSFGTSQTEYHALAEAISGHCRRAYEKLRQQQSLAKHLSVFIQSNRFREDLPQYYNSMDVKLTHPTDDLRYLTTIAKICLRKIYKEGIHYQKVGVMITHLTDKKGRQLDFFHPLMDETLLKTERILTVFDSINQKFGRHTIALAAEGKHASWSMRRDNLSPNYTTRWEDLPVVLAK